MFGVCVLYVRQTHNDVLKLCVIFIWFYIAIDLELIRRFMYVPKWPPFNVYIFTIGVLVLIIDLVKHEIVSLKKKKKCKHMPIEFI